MSNYHLDNSVKYVNMTRDVLEELPRFLQDYFRAIAPRTEARTRYGYATDLKNFMEFLINSNPELRGKQLDSITLDQFASIEASDIEEYLEYATLYTDDRAVVRQNRESGLSRKLSCLRSVYKYYVSHKEYPQVKYNPAEAVLMPKHHKKDIIFMDSEEIRDFLTYVTNYEKVLEKENPHKLAYYKKTKFRDIAIITLILGTGIRVSECVGLNIKDVDFRRRSIIVTRKGGKVQNLYFNEDVEKALREYIDIERTPLAEKASDDSPLFYSMQKKRLGVKSIENMVKKYAEEAIPLKKITAHKLRASYATELYENSGDLYLTAEALGHSSMNTTKVYANMSESRRRLAPKYIKH